MVFWWLPVFYTVHPQLFSQLRLSLPRRSSPARLLDGMAFSSYEVPLELLRVYFLRAAFLCIF